LTAMATYWPGLRFIKKFFSRMRSPVDAN